MPVVNRVADSSPISVVRDAVTQLLADADGRRNPSTFARSPQVMDSPALSLEPLAFAVALVSIIAWLSTQV